MATATVKVGRGDRRLACRYLDDGIVPVAEAFELACVFASWGAAA